jgi:hypothetical protein
LGATLSTRTIITAIFPDDWTAFRGFTGMQSRANTVRTSLRSPAAPALFDDEVVYKS